MSLADLDPVIHAPKRLAIMAMLTASTSTDFPFLREHLAVSDSDLSKQMSALEQAGYVSVTKSRGRGGVTTYRATRAGGSAYRRHVRALRAIVDTPVEQPT
ncbi:MAG: transcriptional regulator [Nocardioidaceae bacterium]